MKNYILLIFVIVISGCKSSMQGQSNTNLYHKMKRAFNENRNSEKEINKDENILVIGANRDSDMVGSYALKKSRGPIGYPVRSGEKNITILILQILNSLRNVKLVEWIFNSEFGTLISSSRLIFALDAGINRGTSAIKVRELSIDI